MTYTIKLENGTELSDLELNGNNFISSAKITEDNFNENLGKITITDSDGNVTEKKNLELIQITHPDDKYWFVLRELSTEELEKAQLQSDLNAATDAIAELTELIASITQ